MILIGKSRPVASEYPQIADYIRQAIEDVYYGVKQELDDAAKRSAKVLGWQYLHCVSALLWGGGGLPFVAALAEINRTRKRIM